LVGKKSENAPDNEPDYIFKELPSKKEYKSPVCMILRMAPVSLQRESQRPSTRIELRVMEAILEATFLATFVHREMIV